jgi:signal transduction histidine kinase
MEPLTTFSLFCNIVTTVDAAIRISRELKELYDSSSGLVGDKQRLQRETAQMRKIIAELNATRRKLPADPVQHPLIAEIAKECADLTDKINAILDECKAEGGRPKYIAVVKAWRRSRKKKPELDKLLSELQSTTQRLQTAIAAASQ